MHQEIAHPTRIPFDPGRNHLTMLADLGHTTHWHKIIHESDTEIIMQRDEFVHEI